MQAQRRESTPVPALFGLWDATSLIVGIIIGVGIFQTPPRVFSDAPQLWPALSTWFFGGLFALIGAFCFAELASAYLQKAFEMEKAELRVLDRGTEFPKDVSGAAQLVRADRRRVGRPVARTA
jgi:hypothetical protein